jgi:hypothetical protein
MDFRSRQVTAVVADMTVSVVLHLAAAAILVAFIAGLLWRGR